MDIFKRKEIDRDEEYTWRDSVYLVTVNDSFQADLLESKLRSEDIPCQRKYVGSAGYVEIVFGANKTGEIELYVPKQCLEDARNIIQPVDLDDCEPVPDEE